MFFLYSEGNWHRGEVKDWSGELWQVRMEAACPQNMEGAEQQVSLQPGEDQNQTFLQERLKGNRPEDN